MCLLPPLNELGQYFLCTSGHFSYSAAVCFLPVPLRPLPVLLWDFKIPGGKDNLTRLPTASSRANYIKHSINISSNGIDEIQKIIPFQKYSLANTWSKADGPSKEPFPPIKLSKITELKKKKEKKRRKKTLSVAWGNSWNITGSIFFWNIFC